MVDHSEAASREGRREGSGLEPSSFGDASVRSQEEGLLGRARFATIVAQEFVAYSEADGLVTTLFGSRDAGKTSTLTFALDALGGIVGVRIRNEAMLPRGSAHFVETGGRLLGSDDRARGRAIA